MDDVVQVLRAHGIQPSAQRVAIARYVLRTDEHPCAEEVWGRVRRDFPTLSRATVYNTLNSFVKKGLLRTQVLQGSGAVFDPLLADHHHFIDETTGRIHDVAWGDLEVRNISALEGYEVRSYQVVLRGRRLK